MSASGPDGLDVVAVQPLQNVLDLIGHIVNVAAQVIDVVPLNRGDEGFDQRVEQRMLLFVGAVLNRVHFVQLFADRFGVVLAHGAFQQVRGLAGILGTGEEGIEVKRILVFRHEKSSIAMWMIRRSS